LFKPKQFNPTFVPGLKIVSLTFGIFIILDFAPTDYSQYSKPPPPPFSPPPAYNSVEPPPPSYNTSAAYPATGIRY